MSNPQIEAEWERKARAADNERHEIGITAQAAATFPTVVLVSIPQQLAYDLLEFLDGQADCEVLANGYHPNQAMRLQLELKSALDPNAAF